MGSVGRPVQPEGASSDAREELIMETSGGEEIAVKGTSLIVRLPEGRSTMTTSWLNGGYRDDVSAVINHQLPAHLHGSLGGKDLPGYLGRIAGGLGLDPGRTTGLLTSASMRNAATETMSYRGVEVTAVVTAGIEVNGGRAGDPASYYQRGDGFEKVGGTINTILLIGAHLPEHAMARSIVTASEAKACALQELMAPSRYSCGIASGSGTDMIAVVADRTSPHLLSDPGKHSKLGEMIGRCVIEATTVALERQSGLTPLYQRDVLIRLERFGIDEKDIWRAAAALPGDNRRGQFLDALRQSSKDPFIVAAAASVLHLVDEVRWGLVPENAARRAALATMRQVIADVQGDAPTVVDGPLSEDDDILVNLTRTLAFIVKHGNGRYSGDS